MNCTSKGLPETTQESPVVLTSTTIPTTSIKPENVYENSTIRTNSSNLDSDIPMKRNNYTLGYSSPAISGLNSSISQNNTQNLTTTEEFSVNTIHNATTTQRPLNYYMNILNIHEKNFFTVRLYSNSSTINTRLYDSAKRKFEEVLQLIDYNYLDKVNYSILGLNLFLHYLIKNSDNLEQIKRIKNETEEAIKKIIDLRINFLSIIKDESSCKLQIFVEFMAKNQENHREFELKNYDMKIGVICEKY